MISDYDRPDFSRRGFERICAWAQADDLRRSLANAENFRTAGQYGRAHLLANAVANRLLALLEDAERENAVLEEAAKRIELLEQIIATARLKNPSMPELQDLRT